MPTRIENRIEELIFDVAEELKLSDTQVQRLDVARIGALALARLRVEVESDARSPHGDERRALVSGVASVVRRLALRFREVLVS